VLLAKTYQQEIFMRRKIKKRKHFLDCSNQIINYQTQKIAEFRTKDLESMQQEIIAPQMLLHIREICASKASHSIGGARLELLIKNITDSPGHFICALEGTNQQDSIIAARESLTEMKRAVITLLNTLLNDELQQIRRTVMIDNPADSSVTSTVIDFANWLDNPLAMITHLQEYCNRYEADKKSSRPLKKAWGLTIQAIKKIAYFWFPGCIDVLIEKVPQLREQYKAQQAERSMLTLELAGGDLLTSLPDSTEPLEQQLYDRDLGRGIADSFSEYPEGGEESDSTTGTQARPHDPFAGLAAFHWDAHRRAATSAVQDEDHIWAAQGSAVSHLVSSHTPGDRLNPWGSGSETKAAAEVAVLQQTVQDSGAAVEQGGSAGWNPFDAPNLSASHSKPAAMQGGGAGELSVTDTPAAEPPNARAGWHKLLNPNAAQELAERLAERKRRQAEIKGQEHAAGNHTSTNPYDLPDAALTASNPPQGTALSGRNLFKQATSGELDASEGKASKDRLAAELF
jgi:hypothetical protein